MVEKNQQINNNPVPVGGEWMNEYAESLIEKGGFGSLPEEFKNNYREKIMEEAQKRLGMVATDALDGKSMEQYLELLDKEDQDPNELNEFLKSHIDNFEEKMREALAEFAREFLQGVKDLADENVGKQL